MAKKIVIAASGGGHTGYAVALAQRLYGRADMVFLVPRGDEWSKQKVERFGPVVEVTKARGPRDSLAKALPKLFKAMLESLAIDWKEYEVFVSTGSNHSIPPAIAAKLAGLKVVNVESCVRFTKPSRSAKLLARFADITVLQWEEQKELYPDGVVVGPLYSLPEYEPYDGGYILVSGGTYGFKQLFDAFLKLPYDNVVLQTGRVDPEPYRKARPSWIVFEFDKDFDRWIAGARVVVAHLGKTALDAALTYRKPLVLVPNPEWKLGAGVEDAEHLAKKLNAVLTTSLDPKDLEQAIEEAMKRRPPVYPDGAAKLAEIVLSL